QGDGPEHVDRRRATGRQVRRSIGRVAQGRVISAVHDALVLAGGAGRRLGGASKPEVLIGGVSLLDRVLEATARARRVVVVGPSRLARPGVPTVMEEPPGGGPVAGIDAGLRFLETRVPSAVGGRG